MVSVKMVNSQFQKIFISPLHRRRTEIPSGEADFRRGQILSHNSIEQQHLGGGWVVSKAKMPTVEGMDISWNHTMQAASRLNMQLIFVKVYSSYSRLCCAKALEHQKIYNKRHFSNISSRHKLQNKLFTKKNNMSLFSRVT